MEDKEELGLLLHHLRQRLGEMEKDLLEIMAEDGEYGWDSSTAHYKISVVISERKDCVGCNGSGEIRIHDGARFRGDGHTHMVQCRECEGTGKRKRGGA